VVSGWPGLEVTAFDADGTELRTLHMERLAPTILLYLAEGVIDHVYVHEPAETMHFGVDPLGGILMRYVTVPNGVSAVPGAPITAATVSVPWRGAGVIAIDPLAKLLQKALQAQTANNLPDGNPRPFTSAEFALEMVENAQSVRFNNLPGTGH
jgi:hypothetical protein